MFGISWGGFNSIHMAMRNPPALKAIIAVDATDDLYQDDVHFMDGMMHVDSWEMSQDLANAMPGAPDYRIDERYFEQRFDTPPWMLTYKRQQRDGPFWERTALKARYDSIRIPTFVIGGWYDGYRDSVPRMLEHMKAPVKAIVGAWNHAFPHEPYPKPGIEWRHEAVRWFDQWLKGRDTGIMQEPRLAVYVRQAGTRPVRTSKRRRASGATRTAGRSRASANACSIRGRTTLLSEAAPGAAAHTAALRAHDRRRGRRPGDVVRRRRRRTSGRATPSASSTRRRRSSGPRDPRPAARAAAGVGGRAARALVRASVRRRARRHGHARGRARARTAPTASRPGPEGDRAGPAFSLEIEMHFTSWVFPKGHRMRLAVSNAQWPMIWPTPYPMTTSLHLGRRGLAPAAAGRARRTSGRGRSSCPSTSSEDRLPGFEPIERRDDLGLRRDRLGRAQPAEGHGEGGRDERERQPFPWGEEPNTRRSSTRRRTAVPRPRR